jgi:hypothetical protein
MADRQSKLFCMGKIYPLSSYLSGNSSKLNGPASERGDLRMGPGLSFDSFCTKQYDFNVMVPEADRRMKRLDSFLNFMLHTFENSVRVCHRHVGRVAELRAGRSGDQIPVGARFYAHV